MILMRKPLQLCVAGLCVFLLCAVPAQAAPLSDYGQAPAADRELRFETVRPKPKADLNLPLVAPKAEISDINPLTGLKPPDESGKILVVMYHGLDRIAPSDNFMCTVKDFENDLKQMYEEGYRPVSMSDYANNAISVEAGCTPILLTFDDGMSTAFSLVEKDGKLVPAPNCAVDIMNRFAEEHPDFGKAATFFINGAGRPAFFGAGTYADRFQYLIENGYDIGNHTYSHADLRKKDAAQIQKEMALVEKLVAENAPGYKMLAMAYPYGERPKEALLPYVLKGEYDGVKYDYALAFRATPGVHTATPNNKNYDIYDMPRVRGTDNAVTDLGWQFRRFRENPDLRYVSDGEPKVISVPVANTSRLNLASFKNMILNIFDAP